MSGPNKWRHRFNGHISRWKTPRETILDFLYRSSKHMSAKEIYASLHKSHPGIGLTTVYRTLDLLNRIGLLTRINSGDGQTRYEFVSELATEHHHHFICTECGNIIDYSEFLDEELRLIRKTEERLSKKYKFKILDHNIEFFGICEKCRKSHKGGE